MYQIIHGEPRLQHINAFGLLDGLQVKILSPDSVPDIQKAMYDGWLHDVKMTNNVVFLPDGTICHGMAIFLAVGMTVRYVNVT